MAVLERQDLSGLLLAGGEGRRMGGQDKGLLPLHGEPLAAHVLRRLTPQVGRLLVSANRHQPQYLALARALDPQAQVLSDERSLCGGEAFAGPLAGMLAGLLACQTEWLLCTPCDLPALPQDLAARLWAGSQARAGGARPVAFPRDREGRLHPACCLLRRDLAPSLSDYLARGGRRVREWMYDQGAIEVAFEHPQDLRAFANLNHPADLAALQAQPALHAAPPEC